MIRCRVMGCGQLRSILFPCGIRTQQKGLFTLACFISSNCGFWTFTSYRCPFLYVSIKLIASVTSIHSQTHKHNTKMPVILASLVFAISLSLLPYTDSRSETEAAEMDRLRSLYLTRRPRSIESRVKEENRWRWRVSDLLLRGIGLM
jgi:hypothetical protein